MTSALISLAASSLLALNAGNSGTQASAPAAQQAQAGGPTARGQGPVAGANNSRVSGARPAGARPSHARSRSAGDSHARTPPPDRSGGSGASAPPPSSSGGGSPPPHSSGGGSPPPPSSGGGYHAPPRGASSHAVPAHAPYGPRPAPHAAPPPHYTTWTPAQQRAYVMRHYHVAPYQPRYWATGVFIYQPPPPPPRVAGAPRHAKVAEPARDVNHSNSLSIGLQTGSYLSGYANGSSYSDLGFGLNARYRGNEALGVEVSYGYFSDSFTSSTERVTQPLSASVDLFAFPWTKVSPYLSGGVTWTKRSYNDTIAMASTGQPAQTFQTKDMQFGPHIGLGLDLSLGKKSSLDLEGRYTHFVTHEDGVDVSSPDNLQGIIGLNMYF